ncbi:MAG: BREX system ATP-binding protein BrxD [Polyangiaceae bacterium]
MSRAASPLKRREIIDALRIGAVPRRGLELFAVGLDDLAPVLDQELDTVAAGAGKFKAVRGEYGTGKTFFSRWLEHRARERGFATALVQISETDTPLYRLETVYRRAVEALQTKEWGKGAFRALIDKWFYTLEEEVLRGGGVDGSSPAAVAAAVGSLLEQRLARVSATQPHFAAALRACHTARVTGDHAVSEGLIAWLMGQPNVGAGIKRAADIKGELDSRGATGFLQGLLEVLKQTGRAGLLLVLDEVETIQRVRDDSRQKSLNALRQLIDDLMADRYPGMYVLVTGTPQFFDGPAGVKRLQPLAQRLATRFHADPKYDNFRAVQIRLHPFDMGRMLEVGERVRDLYPSDHAERIAARVPNEVIEGLARGVCGQLGGKVGIAPRIFLKHLIDVIDRVDAHPDYSPTVHEDIVIEPSELTDEEAAVAGVTRTVDDIVLDLGDSGGGSLG